jgi:Radial spoke protein 3
MALLMQNLFSLQTHIILPLLQITQNDAIVSKLFDFETDSQPVVGSVVGRALEQALSEVLQEEEVAALRAQQRRLHELRLAEWAEARRVQEREFRLQKEKVCSTDANFLVEIFI